MATDITRPDEDAGWVVEIDLLRDLDEIVRGWLDDMGHAVGSTLPTRQVLLLFVGLQQRLVSGRPRKVLVAAGFQCPAAHASGLDLLRGKIERGDDLRPHLSKGTGHLGRQDALLNDWGIFHLHLGVTVDATGFVERTGPVLFSRFDDDHAYLITVQDHGTWSDIELLETVHKNWPSSIASFRLRGVLGLQPAPTPEDVTVFRKVGIQTMIQLSDGTVYGPPGGGYSSAKTSTKVTMEVIYALKRIRDIEQWVRESIAGDVPPAVELLCSGGRDMTHYAAST